MTGVYDVPMPHPAYPSPGEVDQWCGDLGREAEAASCSADLLPNPSPYPVFGVRHHPGQQYVRFTLGDGGVFYGYWQPVVNGGPAPLLAHLPGYGAEISEHPDLVLAGYNVLHVNPLGYGTPQGPDESKRVNGSWPVLPDTVASFGSDGYRHWLRQALAAIRWARQQSCVQADRLGLFGTSQGGGTALLLASLLRGRVRAVAADLPFLTNFPLVSRLANRGAYQMAFAVLEKIGAATPERLPQAWRALGFVDTTSHAHRLTMPALLTAGTQDTSTPMASIRSLFDRLPGTRSYTELAGQAHGYTAPFLRLAKAWFDVYV